MPLLKPYSYIFFFQSICSPTNRLLPICRPLVLGYVIYVPRPFYPGSPFVYQNLDWTLTVRELQKRTRLRLEWPPKPKLFFIVTHWGFVWDSLHERSRSSTQAVTQPMEETVASCISLQQYTAGTRRKHPTFIYVHWRSIWDVATSGDVRGGFLEHP